MISKLVWIELIVVVLNIINKEYMLALVDIPIFLYIGFLWWTIKKKKTYYVNISFLFLVPLLSALIVNATHQRGMGGIVWSFPIMVLLFFCYGKRQAWLASAIIFCVTLVTGFYYLELAETVRVVIALVMVLFCCILVFNNVFRQYDFLEKKANTDPMTGLLNRMLLKEKLENSIYRYTGKPSVIFCLDVDYFKKINDNFGHQVGDKALIELAKILTSCVRVSDDVFRIGGEEFLVLLNNITGKEALILADKIRAKVDDTQILPDNNVMTISIGIAEHSEEEDWDTWLKRADDALYKAKTSGRNQVAYN